MKKRMQLLFAVVLLAWATQTLLHQWGYGAELSVGPVPVDSTPAEKFVSGSSAFGRGMTLELRGDATVLGEDVKLKQICRWSAADKQGFLPVADLVVARMRSQRSPFTTVTMDQVRKLLRDAGMNLGAVKFVGPMFCTVTRGDASYDERTALQQWAVARQTAAADSEPPVIVPSPVPAKAPVDDVPMILAPPAINNATPASAKMSAEESASQETHNRSLRELLLADLSFRLKLPREKLEVTFDPGDEKLLSLSEPLFHFNLEPRSIYNLGQVTWDVVVLGEGKPRKGAITALARAWQDEVMVNKPLAFRQVIQGEDVTTRRTLVDRLPAEPLLTLPQVVGQQAARELTTGAVVSTRMVDAIPLVKPGQLVTVTVTAGTVQIKTVGRAMEEGAYGQAVKVRNETTRDILEVVMTGPQQGTMDPLPAVSGAQK
jgi:flagella basal body P-ring formation protein FlgA